MVSCALCVRYRAEKSPDHTRQLDKVVIMVAATHSEPSQSRHDNTQFQSYTIMTNYTVHVTYKEDGFTVNEVIDIETKSEALRRCEAELSWENTISAYAVDSNGDLVE